MLIAIPIHLRLHVRPVFDVLMEPTYVAGDLVPWFKTEGDERNEAEREPLPIVC